MAWQNYQNTNSDTRSISQNVLLNSGANILTFYGGPRPTYYDTNNAFNITFGSSTILGNTSYTQNQAWTLITVNFNVATTGFYLLTINNNGTPNDTTISFANFQISTPPNIGVLTVNISNYYPNYNGFNIFNLNQQNIQTINIYPNETIALFSDGQNFGTNSNIQTQVNNIQTILNYVQFKYYPTQVINIRSFRNTRN